MGVCLAILGWYGRTLHELKQELASYKQREQALSEALRNECLTLSQKKKFLQHLIKDEAFMRWLAHEELGYVEPDEVLYKFSSDKTLEK